MYYALHFGGSDIGLDLTFYAAASSASAALEKVKSYISKWNPSFNRVRMLVGILVTAPQNHSADNWLVTNVSRIPENGVSLAEDLWVTDQISVMGDGDY